MGVPQKRERVFFLGMRKDIAEPFLESIDMFHIAPKIDLTFKEKQIYWGNAKLAAPVDDNSGGNYGPTTYD
jgi:site-specific DNA-cytosine methylase